LHAKEKAETTAAGKHWLAPRAAASTPDLVEANVDPFAQSLSFIRSTELLQPLFLPAVAGPAARAVL
jgi:hypothetical protein